MLPAYAELHCLSNFSFLRGASHPEELVERAQALGYAALALTDECSLAGVVRAHLAAKDAGLPLVIGSEFTLADGVKLVLLATDRASYGDLAQLITRGRRSAAKGTLRARRATTSRRSRRRCLALWLPALDPRARRRRRRCRVATARWIADVFADRAWIAVELFARAGDRARLARCAALARASGPAAGRRRRRPHARARAPRAAGHADRDPPEARRSPSAATRSIRNGERHLRSRARLAHALSAASCSPRRVAIARALHVLARRAALRISGGDRAAGRDAGVAPAQAHRGGTGAALSARRRCPPDVRELIEHELALIAELRYEPYFLTVARHRRVRALRRTSSARAAARRPTRRSATRSASPRSIRRG